MAFGKITKQDLVDAGLDPDKLKEFQEKGVTKEMLDTMKGELTTSLTSTITDQIKAGFTELEGKLRPKEPEKKTENNNNERTAEDDQNDFLTDPVGFIKKSSGGAAAYAAVEVKKTQIQIAFDSLSHSLPGFKNDTLRKEIEDEWKKYTPEAMVRSNTDPVDLLKKVHNMIMGAHHEEIIQDSNKKEGKYNLVHSGGGGGVNATNDKDDKDKKPTLTDKEKKVAKQFGLSDDEYIQQQKDMVDEESKRHMVGA